MLLQRLHGDEVFLHQFLGFLAGLDVGHPLVLDEDLLELLRPDLAVDLEDHFDVVFLQPTESRALFPGFAGLAFVMFEEFYGIGELEPEIDGPE